MLPVFSKKRLASCGGMQSCAKELLHKPPSCFHFLLQSLNHFLEAVARFPLFLPKGGASAICAVVHSQVRAAECLALPLGLSASASGWQERPTGWRCRASLCWAFLTPCSQVRAAVEEPHSTQVPTDLSGPQSASLVGTAGAAEFTKEFHSQAGSRRNLEPRDLQLRL